MKRYYERERSTNNDVGCFWTVFSISNLGFAGIYLLERVVEKTKRATTSSTTKEKEEKTQKESSTEKETES